MASLWGFARFVVILRYVVGIERHYIAKVRALILDDKPLAVR